MLGKIKKTLILEKIPAIVCAMACMASVLMGFMLGYIFFSSGEPVVVYADANPAYQSSDHHIAHPPPQLNYVPIQNPVSAYNHHHVQDEPMMASHLYIITALDGYIAIYYAEQYGGGLKELTSTAVGTLAPEELEQLQIGIKIYSDEALARILQDYGS